MVEERRLDLCDAVVYGDVRRKDNAKWCEGETTKGTPSYLDHVNQSGRCSRSGRKVGLRFHGRAKRL